jgi:chorismate synthase
MAARIREVKARKDSCGGTITCVITNVPTGLGEPVFDKFHAELGKAMLSIPAVKGFEIGSGFEGSRSLYGSQNNDRFLSMDDQGKARFASNNAGGVLGGVTSGQNVYFRVALKAVSSIGQSQSTCDFEGYMTDLTLQGRHDPCVLPRAVQIVESMAALTVMDFVLRQDARSLDRE